MMSDSHNGDLDLESSYPAGPPPPEPMFTSMTQGSSSQSGISVDDENPGFDRGHSLPNVDELKTEHRAKSSEFVSEDGELKRRRGGWVVWLALFLAVVVIGVIVGVAVALTKEEDSNKASSAQIDITVAPAPTIAQKPTDDGKDTGNDATPEPATVLPATPPTNAPVAPAPSDNNPEIRLALTKSWLVDQGISSEADLNTQGSAQQKALNFMAVQDGLKMAIPSGDKTTREGYDFMTRYVLTVFFHATKGDRWVYSLNFLLPFSACYWYSVLQYPNLKQEFRGVACNEDGEVAALFLSKLL